MRSRGFLARRTEHLLSSSAYTSSLVVASKYLGFSARDNDNNRAAEPSCSTGTRSLSLQPTCKPHCWRSRLLCPPAYTRERARPRSVSLKFRQKWEFIPLPALTIDLPFVISHASHDRDAFCTSCFSPFYDRLLIRSFRFMLILVDASLYWTRLLRDYLIVALNASAWLTQIFIQWKFIMLFLAG